MTMRTQIAAFLLACAAGPATAQVSLASAVDLAVRNSPKVKSAQALLEKAEAALQEAKAVYIPQVSGNLALGNSNGYSTNAPVLFTLNSQSLVYNAQQRDYIRSARAGLTAAQLTLTDAQQASARDTALAYIALLHDQQREAVLAEESGMAQRLVAIEQDRLDAGRDTAIDLTTAKLTAAQFALSRLHAGDATAEDAEHLALLLGVPAPSLRVSGDLPPMPVTDLKLAIDAAPMPPAVAAAFANARAKQEQAVGDAHFLYRPQVSLFLQYNRYATFYSSFKLLEQLYGKSLGADEEAYGVQITIPFFDKPHKARALESAADAASAYHEAEQAQFLALDGRAKLGHSIAELRAKADVARLEQELAREQLDAISTQLNLAASTGGQPLTPKDEQNQRLAEREKYLALLDAGYQLREAEINLMHESRLLGAWLKQDVLPSAPTP